MPVVVTKEMKIVATVLGISVLFAVATVCFVAFVWRPKRKLKNINGETGGEAGQVDGDTEVINYINAVESRELEDRAVNKDGSNQAPSNMVPKYD